MSAFLLPSTYQAVALAGTDILGAGGKSSTNARTPVETPEGTAASPKVSSSRATVIATRGM